MEEQRESESSEGGRIRTRRGLWHLRGLDLSVVQKSPAATVAMVAIWLGQLACADAVEFRREKLADTSATVGVVDIQKERLELFLNDEHGQPFRRFDRLAAWLGAKGRSLVFAMNAGMYHRDYSAVGLFVSDGKQFAPLNLQNGEGNFFLKPNGVFAITSTGARVFESSELQQVREPISLATQSGPLLVHRGRIHPIFNPRPTSRLIRNGVGVPTPDKAIFAITEEPVSFHEFATFFRDQLKCPDALFLDGTVSSLHSAALDRSDFKIDLGPIIAITASNR